MNPAKTVHPRFVQPLGSPRGFLERMCRGIAHPIKSISKSKTYQCGARVAKVYEWVCNCIHCLYDLPEGKSTNVGVTVSQISLVSLR